ncbi:MAG: hypothetical protein AUJ57_06915 [Zetaproteobacteria bacterium CG1_02_53_45]|nr:MAG: hypothetical protein AUJ57_06915 [Zetaproteobacteria bacterium CG1_02_53_45]
MLLVLLCLPVTAVHAQDDPLVFNVTPSSGMTVQQLHSDVRLAANMALPQLWNHVVPASAQHKIPRSVNAISFLQRATPTAQGVTITFQESRVFAWLKANNIPRIGEQPAVSSFPAASAPVQSAASAGAYLLLRIEHRASLPEQVLFEEDLRRESRILDLSLRQVSRDGQQYRLRLNGTDDQWLVQWFKRRGMTLSPTIEGWVAR